MSLPKIVFRTCPECHGYGVRDSGKNCTTCGGNGRGGLLGSGTIGSGEIMLNEQTGERVTAAQLARMLKPDPGKEKQGNLPLEAL